jgi:hypothetical protein
MSFLKVNHNEAQSFEPLPEGEYEVVVSETKVDKSTQKQTPYVGMTMTVRDEADINPVGRKRKIFHNLYYTDKTVGQFQSLFKALLFDQGREFNELADVAKAIKGCTVRVKLRHEQYQDAQGNNKVAERVHYFMESQKPLIRPTGASSFGDDPFATSGSVDISDDNLPF